MLLFHYSAAGSGEVNQSFLLAFLFSNGSSCKMCFQLSDYMSLNILILYDWEQWDLSVF